MKETWASGPMVCLGCGDDEGVHTWLVGSEPVECGECAEMLMVPKEPDVVWGQPVNLGE